MVFIITFKSNTCKIDNLLRWKNTKNKTKNSKGDKDYRRFRMHDETEKIETEGQTIRLKHLG